jgi:putative CocE/NonD family hydrolase
VCSTTSHALASTAVPRARVGLRLLAGALAATLAVTVAASIAAADGPTSFTWEKEIFVPMRDGIRLSTDVLLPKGVRGPLPTVLVRTPYDKDRVEWPVLKALLEKFLARGYAVVIQNERGRWFSEGVYENYLSGANTDGYDTLTWIAQQPWSSGKVGTLGCSSSGEQQWGMASGNHPAHAAMLPLASGTAVGAIPGNDTQGAMYRGGVPLSGLWAWWYNDMAATERLLLPPDTTQQQRIRLRKGYTFQQSTEFYRLKDDGSLDWLTKKVDFAVPLQHLPSAEILRAFGGPLTPYDKYLTWAPADPRWRAVETIKADARPRVPAIHYSTWHDVGVGESVRLFRHLQDVGTPNQYLVIGAGPHCDLEDEDKFGNYTFGDLALGDIRYGGTDRGYEKLYLDWFDYWVAGKRNSVTETARVQLYVMNRGWVTGPRYPLPQTKFTPYYLAAATPGEPTTDSGSLTTAQPRHEDAHAFVYDPADPTPTRGGGCCEINNAVDQRPVETRKDVLVYSSPTLSTPVSIAGQVSVTLYVSSSAKDTDFMVKLVDVLPDGRAVNMSDDAFRMRYRDGYDKKVLMAPGGVYEITLSNMVAGVRFGRGHRIRLEVASSNFPLMERNLNTGGNNYDETAWVVARNTLHVGGKYPSRIVLPEIPE